MGCMESTRHGSTLLSNDAIYHGMHGIAKKTTHRQAQILRLSPWGARLGTHQRAQASSWPMLGLGGVRRALFGPTGSSGRTDPAACRTHPGRAAAKRRGSQRACPSRASSETIGTLAAEAGISECRRAARKRNAQSYKSLPRCRGRSPAAPDSDLPSARRPQATVEERQGNLGHFIVEPMDSPRNLRSF